VKILLAGPGTGKTTRVKDIIGTDYPEAERVLVLSFTNATVNDLTAAFAEDPRIQCLTLHKFALKISPLRDLYILDGREEEPNLRELAKAIEIGFSFLCERLGCITFDGMVSECLRFLRANPVYAEEKIGPLDILIVDEYQDFNPDERALVAEIARLAKDTVILGDDDQCIYGFKDADPDGIIQAFRDPSVDKLYHVNKCWRCPDDVVEHARNLIEHNAHRVAKAWEPTGRPGEFKSLQVRTQTDAIDHVASEIARVRQETAGATFLVLSPMGFCADGLTTALDEAGIPFVDFWNEPLTEDQYQLVWWLRAIYAERELLNLVLLRKTLTSHFRRKLKEVLKSAFATGEDEGDVIDSIKPMFDAKRAGLHDNPPSLTELVDQHPEFKEIASHLDPNALAESAAELLQKLVPTQACDWGCVNIMSIHKSKGLQADVVFILGLVEGILPNDSRGTDSIEAQRRLLFVGATRARTGLHLVSWLEWSGSCVHKVDKSKFDYQYAKKCYYGRASRFLTEMT
jgi:DNA helicase II / ATP-dependent DNA helicase PcrA